MAQDKNDNWNILAAKPSDNRQGKWVAGAWEPFSSVAEALSLTIYRYKTQVLPVLIGTDIIEYWFKNGTADNDLVPKNPRAYISFASLSSTTDRYENGAILATKGYYTENDGGGATYIVSSTPLSGLLAGSTAQISLPGGKYGILYHQGSVNLEQFGAKGDGTTNDYDAINFANNFKKVQSNLHTIYGTPNKQYLLRKMPRAHDGSGSSFWTDCYLRIDYSGCTWDGRGAKILWDNNFNQSRVYYTKDGHTNVYRAKLSNVNHPPQVGTKAENSWYEYYWQVMEQDVTPDGSYPVWNSAVQYNGAETFAHIGYPPSAGLGKVENITFRNWDISGMETDAVALDSGMWNIFAKGFYIFYGYNNILYDTIDLHHICSEMFYGGANTEAGRQTITRCKIHMGHNGISGGGYPFYIQDNLFQNLSANGIENFPFDGKLVITGNTFTYCGNGATIGGPGNDLQVQGHVTVDNNTFYNIFTYGIYFSGRARGVTVTNNIMYDAGISFYMLSNLGFPMTASEYTVSGNQIYARDKNMGFAIVLNSAAADLGDYTTNISFDNNTIGTTALSSLVGGYNVSTAFSFYGDIYKDIFITNNKFVGRVTQYYEYVVKSSNWSPIFKNNSYRADYNDYHFYGTGGANTYSSPITFDPRYIKGDNVTLQVGSYLGSQGWETSFFMAPDIHNHLNKLDNEGVFVSAYHGNRVVLMPSGQDNLTRSRSFVCLGNNGYFKTGVGLRMVQSYECYSRDVEKYLRSWQYEGFNRTIEVPNTVPHLISGIFGNIPAGETRFFDVNPVWYHPNFDQFYPDRDYVNNLLLTSGITILSYNIEYSGNFFLRVTIQNTSGSTISMDGKVVAFKCYPISKPDKLPTNLAPLKDEGMTNMLPTGSDIPHRWLFRDVEANTYLEFNKKTGAWASI